MFEKAKHPNWDEDVKATTSDRTSASVSNDLLGLPSIKAKDYSDYCVIKDLLVKYEKCLEFGANTSDAAAFEKVFMYYLTHDEIIYIKEKLLEA